MKGKFVESFYKHKSKRESEHLCFKIYLTICSFWHYGCTSFWHVVICSIIVIGVVTGRVDVRGITARLNEIRLDFKDLQFNTVNRKLIWNPSSISNPSVSNLFHLQEIIGENTAHIKNFQKHIATVVRNVNFNWIWLTYTEELHEVNDYNSLFIRQTGLMLFQNTDFQQLSR